MNTGVLRTRDNQIVADVGFGKSALLDAGWRKSLNQVEKKLHRLRVSVAKALAEGSLKSCHDYCYCGDAAIIDSLDTQRADIIETINFVLSSGSVPPVENVLGQVAGRKRKNPTTRSTITRNPRQVSRR